MVIGENKLANRKFPDWSTGTNGQNILGIAKVLGDLSQELGLTLTEVSSNYKNENNEPNMILSFDEGSKVETHIDLTYFNDVKYGSNLLTLGLNYMNRVIEGREKYGVGHIELEDMKKCLGNPAESHNKWATGSSASDLIDIVEKVGNRSRLTRKGVEHVDYAGPNSINVGYKNGQEEEIKLKVKFRGPLEHEGYRKQAFDYINSNVVGSEKGDVSKVKHLNTKDLRHLFFYGKDKK